MRLTSRRSRSCRHRIEAKLALQYENSVKAERLNGSMAGEADAKGAVSGAFGSGGAGMEPATLRMRRALLEPLCFVLSWFRLVLLAVNFCRFFIRFFVCHASAGLVAVAEHRWLYGGLQFLLHAA